MARAKPSQNTSQNMVWLAWCLASVRGARTAASDADVAASDARLSDLNAASRRTTARALAAMGAEATCADVTISLGADHTCAILDTGDLKCWGLNQNGQLGYDLTYNTSDEAVEMAALGAVNLGANRTAIAVSTGYSHTRAILDTGDLKCWGFGWYGQLGYDSTDDKGDEAGEMAALGAVNLGANRTAIAVSTG